MTVVAEARSVAEVLTFLPLAECSPNLLICNPSTSTHESDAIKQIALKFPEIQTVILTNQISQPGLELAVDCGAKGFLPDDISPAALLTVLQLILLGENIFAAPANMERTRIAEFSEIQPASAVRLRVPLSPREIEILTCLECGLPNKVIARNLDIAEATVKVHLKAVLRKINAQNRTQAAIWAMNYMPHSKISSGD
jgi:two-component system, NarL family, nitrate/nitrite response regulator NarL